MGIAFAASFSSTHRRLLQWDPALREQAFVPFHHIDHKNHRFFQYGVESMQVGAANGESATDQPSSGKQARIPRDPCPDIDRHHIDVLYLMVDGKEK